MSVSLFLFGVPLLLVVVEEDDGVDAGVVVELGFGAPVLSDVAASFVTWALLAVSGLFVGLGLFGLDGPAVLFASSSGRSKSNP